MFVWMGDPVAFTIGSVSMRWYGILFALGFVIGYFMMVELFKRAKYNTNDLDRLLVYIFAGTVIGARLGHCFIYEPDFYLSNPLEILKIWRGGLASHGGTVGVLIAFFIFIKRNKQYSFLEIGDMLCIPIAMVCCFIRIGNFMNSEILGKPTGSDFGVVFARLGETFPRYPAQLFEAGSYLLTFVILSICYFKWKNRPRGLIIAMLFFFIYTSRFFIEPLKEEQADYSTGMILNVGQLLSIPFVLGSLLFAWYVCKYQKPAQIQNNSQSTLENTNETTSIPHNETTSITHDASQVANNDSQHETTKREGSQHEAPQQKLTQSEEAQHNASQHDSSNNHDSQSANSQQK